MVENPVNIKKMLVLIILMIFILNINSLTISISLKKSYVIQEYTLHDPIYINGNNNFTSENGVTGGSGTYDDPYIINGWEIHAFSSDGITIIDTDVFFEIRNCYIHNGFFSYDGIVFYHVKNGVINSSIISNNRYGIIFRYPPHPMDEDSSYNKIINNTISNNIKDGIHFEHTISDHHSYNLIYLNEISYNFQGIYLIMSAYNQIFSNNITLNSEWGVNLTMCMGGGENNMVYHNNFIGNNNENGQACAWWTYGNYWDDGYPSGGNYWSDYKGEDSDGDGIGDIPYEIKVYDEYGYYEHEYDYYPLMEQSWNDTYPPKTTIIFYPSEPDGENKWYKSNVTVSLDAVDYLSGINNTYFKINDGEWQIYNTSFVIIDNGRFTIEYYSVDKSGNIENIKSSKVYIDKAPPTTSLKWETRKINDKWYVRFACNATDITSKLDRGEFYIQNQLGEVISVNIINFEFVFVIEWKQNFKMYEFKVIIFDKAGNSAIEIINGSDIESFSSMENKKFEHSPNLQFTRLFDRFSLMNWFLNFIGGLLK